MGALRILSVGPSPGGGWGERLADLRDRLLTSARFRRLAAAFPPTRPVARSRARALFDLCAGFVYSQVLLACVRLDLFAVLAEGPRDVETLSRRLGLAPDATARLLAAAVSLGLARRRRHDRYGLGPLGAAMVDNPGIAAMVEHHAVLYADLHDPVALLRGEASDTGLKRYWAYAGAGTPSDLDGAAIADYSTLMAASQPMIAEEVLAAYPLKRHRRLLDVGGGEGAFLRAVAGAAPKPDLVLFDLPAVAERARANFAAAGLGDRATAIGGDVFCDPLPKDADLVSLVRVLHDHDDAAALRILQAAHAALEPGGTLLVAEPMAGTAGAAPIGGAYFGFYLMAMGSGRPRTESELAGLIEAAGFGRPRPRRTRTPMLARVIVAAKAGRP